MRIGEPVTVSHQSTNVFETNNFSTLLSYKLPLQDGNIMERRSEHFHPKEPDNQGVTAAFGQGTFHIRELSIRTIGLNRYAVWGRSRFRIAAGNRAAI